MFYLEPEGVRYGSGTGVATQVTGTPPLHNVGFKNILVETLNNVGHPTRCPQSLNSVRLMVSYIVQCLHNYWFKPTLCNGGVPAIVKVSGPLLKRYPLPLCKSELSTNTAIHTGNVTWRRDQSNIIGHIPWLLTGTRRQPGIRFDNNNFVIIVGFLEGTSAKGCSQKT